MKKAILQFSAVLLLGLGLIFSIHLLVHFYLGIPLSSFLIIESYVANYLMVVISYIVLLYFKEKKSQSLGFIFLGGFFFKLIVFMIYFNPVYKADQVVMAEEFFAFFLPYSLCLIYETSLLVRILNRS